MPTKIRISAKKTQQKPLEEGFFDFLKGKQIKPKDTPGKGAAGDPGADGPGGRPVDPPKMDRNETAAMKQIEKYDKLAGGDEIDELLPRIRDKIENNIAQFNLVAKRKPDSAWRMNWFQQWKEKLPNYSKWGDKKEGGAEPEAGEAEAGAPGAGRAPGKQQKGKKAHVKAAEMRAKPVKGKILTTKSVVNRLKAAGITDQKVIDQANRVIKKYIEKAVAGQVPVYEAVNLAVGGQSLLKQLMKIPGLRPVPDSVIKQILKDLEVQLTANDVEVIKTKKDLASSRQKPGKDFDGETGEPLTDAGKEKCAADARCAEKWLKGEGPPSEATPAGEDGATPGVVTDQEAEDLVAATAVRTKSLALDADKKEKMAQNVAKAGTNAVKYLKNTDKLKDADPADVVDATAKRAKTLRGKDPEQQATMTKGVKRAGSDSITWLKGKGKLDEAFVERSEIIYEKLLKKWNIK